MSIIGSLADMKESDYSGGINGVTVGVVTSIDDPSNLGRVKVKLLNRNTSNDETDFIRVASPMVGQRWGMFFWPEVGDEVLVAFSHGEVVRPYVIGTLYNNSDKPPVTITEKKNDIRKIKTKSGHELIFDDTEGANKIEVKTPKDLKIVLDDKAETITISDDNGNNLVKIDSINGMIKVEAQKKINIVCGNSKMLLDSDRNLVQIESTQSIKLTSQQIKIEAQGMLDLKSANVLNVNGTGPTSIKGAVVKLN